MQNPLLTLRDLKVHFPLTGGPPWRRPPVLKAVDGIDLDLWPGRTLGLVGESGCGKSTLARALTGLAPMTAGELVFDAKPMHNASAARWRGLCRDVQMIFQDPLASLDPRMPVGRIVAEPLRYLYPALDRRARGARATAMLQRVGLSAAQANRYPHEFSGGQCQRIGIARALVVEPRVLICDEPISALDVSIQARIIELLESLQAELGIAMLFIAHDLAVVRRISHDVMVMYLGRTMETAPADTLMRAPAHPYTRALLSAVPRPDPQHERQRQRIRLVGDLPSPADPPGGCVFHTRCPWVRTDCARQTPALRELAGGSRAACLYAETIAAGETAREAGVA